MQVVDKDTVVSLIAKLGGSVRDFFEEHGNSGFYDSRDVEAYLGVSIT